MGFIKRWLKEITIFVGALGAALAFHLNMSVSESPMRLVVLYSGGMLGELPIMSYPG